MNGLTIDGVAALGSPEYVLCVLILLFGRGMDLLSTWIATPTLVLEANPIARWLGWRAGVVVNVIACGGIAVLPLAAVSVTTMSVLVAARNLQSAWLVRVLGEHEYRSWIAARYRETTRGVFLICLILQASLLALVGASLMVFSRQQLVPFGVGFGIVTYAVAIAFFTFLGMRRAARAWALAEVEISPR